MLWYYGAADGARELELSAVVRPRRGGRRLHRDRHQLRRRTAPPRPPRARRSGTAAPGDRRRRRAGDVRRPGVGHPDGDRRPAPATSAAPRASVCSFAGDPTVCNLPAAPAPGTAAAAGADTVAPGQPHHVPARRRDARVGARHPRRRRTRPVRRRLGAGGAGPPRRHPVPLPHALGTVSRRRALHRAGVCVTARTVGGNWSLALDRHGPGPGAVARLEPRDRRRRQRGGHRPVADQHRPVPRRRPRRDEAGRARAALAVLALAAVAPQAGAATADERAAERAATWLAANSAGAPAGQQADVIVALRAAGPRPGRAVAPPRAPRPRRARLRPHGRRRREGRDGRRRGGRGPAPPGGRQLPAPGHDSATPRGATGRPPSTRRCRCWRGPAASATGAARRGPRDAGRPRRRRLGASISRPPARLGRRDRVGDRGARAPRGCAAPTRACGPRSAWMTAQRNAGGRATPPPAADAPPTPTPRRARSARCVRWGAPRRPRPARRCGGCRTRDGGVRFDAGRAPGSRLHRDDRRADRVRRGSPAAAVTATFTSWPCGHDRITGDVNAPPLPGGDRALPHRARRDGEPGAVAGRARGLRVGGRGLRSPPTR